VSAFFQGFIDELEKIAVWKLKTIGVLKTVPKGIARIPKKKKVPVEISKDPTMRAALEEATTKAPTMSRAESKEFLQEYLRRRPEALKLLRRAG
jgi:hypothetical protein